MAEIKKYNISNKGAPYLRTLQAQWSGKTNGKTTYDFFSYPHLVKGYATEAYKIDDIPRRFQYASLKENGIERIKLTKSNATQLSKLLHEHRFYVTNRVVDKDNKDWRIMAYHEGELHYLNYDEIIGFEVESKVKFKTYYDMVKRKEITTFEVLTLYSL